MRKQLILLAERYHKTSEERGYYNVILLVKVSCAQEVLEWKWAQRQSEAQETKHYVALMMSTAYVQSGMD